jgi:hypothetical protein
MIDNFNIIGDIITGKKLTDDNFFLVQCIRRHKDVGNEEMKSNNIVVDNFFVTDASDLIEKKEKIIRICDLHNARAYIRLNKRSYRKVALQTMALIAETIANNNYQIKNAYLSTCGKFSEERTFLVDVDYDDVGEDFDHHKMFLTIGELLLEAKKSIEEIYKIPTRNGYHYITPGFNTQKFGMLYPMVSIHKDNPTVLYVP